jgi:glycopeptide antibiotics resistance protein
MILIIYVLVLFKVICMKYLDIADLTSRIGDSNAYRPYNLIPFVTISKYFMVEQMSLLRRAGNILGNIYLFVPLGLLLPLVCRKANNIWIILFLSLILSIFFEAAQYALASGSSDIDDVILNTAGGISGLLLFRLIRIFSKNETLQSILVLSVFVVLVASGFWVAMKEFNLDLGLKRISEEDFISPKIGRTISVSDTAISIPVRDCDAMGYFEEIHGDTIFINKFAITKDTGSKGKQSIAIMTPRTKHSVFSFFLTENTYILRKEVESYSTTEFDIMYRLSTRDSIVSAQEIQFWTSHDDSTRIDTLCYWVVHRHY